MIMTVAYPLITNDALLKVALEKWPDDRLAAVCSCGKIFDATKIPGHIGGSNRKWTVKAKFSERHRVVGYTLLPRCYWHDTKCFRECPWCDGYEHRCQHYEGGPLMEALKP